MENIIYDIFINNLNWIKQNVKLPFVDLFWIELHSQIAGLATFSNTFIYLVMKWKPFLTDHNNN